MENKIYKIDASGEKLGRLASKTAAILLGKNRTDFAKNTIAPVKVEITNASKMSILDKKIDTKIYTSYSGYPGGLIERKMSKVITDKGFGDALKRAIYRMIPGNRLRAKIMLNLKISE
ncbi:MAG: uL13 family ribosomal protein [Minisyncoccia bacterium]